VPPVGTVIIKGIIDYQRPIRRLTHLKVKIKTLAAESRIIRLEQRKATAAGDETGTNILHHRRIVEVRHAARAALLAYGYLRGRLRHQLEATFPAFDEPRWVRTWEATRQNVERFSDERPSTKRHEDLKTDPLIQWLEGRVTSAWPGGRRRARTGCRVRQPASLS